MTWGSTDSSPKDGKRMASPASNPSDPSYWITQIDDYLSGHTAGNTDVAYLMYLVGQYQSSIVGQDAAEQAQMTKYVNEAQQLWQYLQECNGLATTSLAGISATTAFSQLCTTMMIQLSGDPFFSGANAGMLTSIIQTLSSAENTVLSAGSFAGAGLAALWKEYNAQGPDGPQAGPMKALMADLTQLNQQFTGQSQAVQAQAQQDMKMSQTIEGALNNWFLALKKIQQYFIQNYRTQ